MAGIGEAAWAAAVRHIAAVRDSDFRLLSGPVVEPWLKLTPARRPGRPREDVQVPAAISSIAVTRSTLSFTYVESLLSKTAGRWLVVPSSDAGLGRVRKGFQDGAPYCAVQDQANTSAA